MRTTTPMTWMLAGALCVAAGITAHAVPPSPSEFLGFTVGADRTLADYRQIKAYLQALDAASPRVVLQDLGKTTLGEDLVMAVISSEENLRNLPRIQEVAKRLADPRGLSDAEAERLVGEGRVVLLVTCNIHSNEIGASQMAMEWAHALATAQDAETRRRLEAVVVLLVPSLNPDGQIMETEWYRKQLGTRYEGSRMPWLYHHYVGHDDNRDWFMLTQKETRAMTRAVYREWFPAGLARRAPDGRERTAHLRAAVRRSGRHRHPSAGLARGEPDRVADGAAPGAAAEVRGDLRLLLRRVLAGRHQEHGLVEEHHRPADRGGVGAHRHAGPHRPGRAVGRTQGPRRIRGADELPEPVARRPVAPARHHGLRAHRVRRAARGLRGPPRRLPARRARPRARRRRRLRCDRRLPDSRAAARRRVRPPAGGAHGGARRRGEAGRGRRRVDTARPALRPLRARDVRATGLPGGQARARTRHRASVRRLGLDAAVDDGRPGGAGGAAAGPVRLPGAGAAPAGRERRRAPARQPRERAPRERRPALTRPRRHRPRCADGGRSRVAGGHRLHGRGRGVRGAGQGRPGPGLDGKSPTSRRRPRP